MQRVNGYEVVEIPYQNGLTDLEALKGLIDGDIAAVLVQYPNFFGGIEPLKELEELIHAQKR